jgi:threonine dehydrogenase-like Zn-dependent dehydrogenase
LLAIGRHKEKLVNLETRGIKVGFVDDVKERSFDIAVECTGNSAGFDIARSALRSRGTLILKSTYAGKLNLDASALVVDEITLIGSRCGPFAPALKLLAEEKIDVKPLINASFPLSEGLAAFEYAQTRGVMKVLLEMGE